MPIKPENRDRYPADWKDISARIRFVRARARCECRGECGHDHARENRLLNLDGTPVDAPSDRCSAYHHNPHPITGSRVVLTTAHLDHVPENVDDDNLRAMCQRCHLAYDQDHHRANRTTR